MSKKKRIKELETELRIVQSQLYITSRSNAFHARHNKLFKNYVTILNELESISLKWKFKKFIRRIKSWQK